jgi:hypothetical protein
MVKLDNMIRDITELSKVDEVSTYFVPHVKFPGISQELNDRAVFELSDGIRAMMAVFPEWRVRAIYEDEDDEGGLWHSNVVKRQSDDAFLTLTSSHPTPSVSLFLALLLVQAEEQGQFMDLMDLVEQAGGVDVS